MHVGVEDLSAMSTTDASESHSVKQKQSSSVTTPPGKSVKKIARVSKYILSERATRGVEVAILILVVACVVGLLSIPSVLHFVKRVSVRVIYR